MNRRIDLNDIRLLMQVVEHGSYTAAARQIGIPKSTISQRIAALEATVGTGLLRRTSRSFSLTEAGSELLPHARAIEALARSVEQTLLEQGKEIHGTLRVSCPNAMAQDVVSPLIPRFLDRHERVTIRVEASNRMVDLISGGFDMIIRGHFQPLRDSTLIQRVVARSPWRLAASPRWIAEHGTPATPGDILPGQVLSFSTEPEYPGWVLTSDEGGTSREEVVRVSPRMISDDMFTLRAAAVAGGGIVCVPAHVLRSQLESGELVRVLPTWSQMSTISVLTPPKAQSSRLTAAFSDFLAAELPALMRV